MQTSDKVLRREMLLDRSVEAGFRKDETFEGTIRWEPQMVKLLRQ